MTPDILVCRDLEIKSGIGTRKFRDDLNLPLPFVGEGSEGEVGGQGPRSLVHLPA